MIMQLPQIEARCSTLEQTVCGSFQLEELSFEQSARMHAWGCGEAEAVTRERDQNQQTERLHGKHQGQGGRREHVRGMREAQWAAGGCIRGTSWSHASIPRLREHDAAREGEEVHAGCVQSRNLNTQT